MTTEYDKNQKHSNLLFQLIVFLLLSIATLHAQVTPVELNGMLVQSMGLPDTWKPYCGAMISRDFRMFDGKAAVELNGGMYRDLVNPVISLLGFSGEGYFRTGFKNTDYGLRLLASSKVFYMHGGIDYSFRDARTRFLLSVQSPLWRGGPFRSGGCVRFDWLTGPDNAYGVGLSFPAARSHMGKTRPISDRVTLPKAQTSVRSVYMPDPALLKTLTRMKVCAYEINRFTIPLLDEDINTAESDILAFTADIRALQNHINQTDSLFPIGHSFREEVRVYHQELSRAFSLAIFKGESGDDGAILNQTVQRARDLLLDEVILPYNRLLGQYKKHDSIRGYGSRAEEIFNAWLTVSSDVPARNYEGVRYVFHTLIQIVEYNRDYSRKIWGDSRLVWIPCHYALRFEDHDTEAELDAIIQKAVDQPFTDANDVHYVTDELFQSELERMVRQTEDYHVLWIHDYRGVNQLKKPDAIAFQQTTEAYMKALLDKVKNYDVTRKIPVYMIFLDQNYYESNKSRIWLSLLENPLEHELHLPSEFKDWENAVRRIQQELRAAVVQSAALQSDMQRYGREWLLNKIKVHVSITNPSDLSFRSGSIFRALAFVPDNVMRDHRKIAFYDVTEFDPGKGEAIFTGRGIGEHYAGPTWDDRSIMARGPVLLSIKTAARELLLSQGFDEMDIPEPLRSFPKPQNYEAMIDQLRVGGWTASVMQVHNATGFGMKYANVIKAILYTLMPPGSHLYIPDSLWNSPFWGGMLVGAALRGCVVLVVSPSFKNAPSFGNPQMSRANELFTRFVCIQNQMQKEIQSAGGLFRVGIYNVDLDVGDIEGNIRRIHEGIVQSDLLRRIFPFDSSVMAAFAEMPDYLKSQGLKPSYLTEDTSPRKPKMHFKIQFFASEKTIQTAVPNAIWGEIIRKYVLVRARQAARLETYTDVKALRSELEQESAALMQAWGRTLSQEDRDHSLAYLTVGSQNEDYRGMIMDGETLFVTGHTWAMLAYLDFVMIMGQTTWIDDVKQLEALLPKQTHFWQWVGWYIKLAL
jgi:hypothetical protein